MRRKGRTDVHSRRTERRVDRERFESLSDLACFCAVKPQRLRSFCGQRSVQTELLGPGFEDGCVGVDELCAESAGFSGKKKKLLSCAVNTDEQNVMTD